MRGGDPVIEGWLHASARPVHSLIHTYILHKYLVPTSTMSYPKVKYLQGCAHTKSLRVATQHWYVTGNLAFSAVVANCNNAL